MSTRVRVTTKADAREDFIDKFWIALGWDVNHEQLTDPYKQDVKVERGVATSEFRKRADYAFLAPNFRDVRFFVEAKKPLRESKLRSSSHRRRLSSKRLL
jgi:type I site-specific restriction endonuclease